MNIEFNSKIKFLIAIAFGQACGIIGFLLLIDFIESIGDIKWNPENKIYVHAFMMVFGLVYLQGTSITAFRLMLIFKRQTAKYTHAAIHTCIFVLNVLGLVAIFDVMSKHLLTFHAWLGLITVILFSGQWFFSFLGFLYPKASEGLKEMLIPYHRKFGLIIFTLAVINSLLGLSKFSFTKYTSQHIWIQILILLFGIVTVAILLNKRFKRENL